MQNRRQLYKVLIDANEVGFIKNDGSEEYKLTPGSHSIRCKINWMSSQDYTFDIKPDVNTYLSVGNGMKFFLSLYFLLLSGLLVPLIFKLINQPLAANLGIIRIIAIWPAGIYYLLYLTILRKKYLVFLEDKSNPFK